MRTVSALFFLPLLILTAVLIATWPGYLSFDSAYQFWQARHASFTDVAPPALPALWRILLIFLPETSGPMLVIGAAYAAGFFGFALSVRQSGQHKLAWAISILGALYPPFLVLLPHIWTDVLLAAICLCIAALIAWPQQNYRLALVIAMLLLFASTLRHNSILATVPLALWWLWAWLPRCSIALRLVAAAASIFMLIVGKLMLSAWLVEKPLDTWAVTPMFDLQAVSVATNQQLLPISLVGPGMQASELRAAFHPYSATMLFSNTRTGVVNPVIRSLTPAQREDLLTAWLGLLQEPSYWQHRWRLFCGLLGTHSSDEIAGFADSPELHQYLDNPALVRSNPGLHMSYRRVIEWLRGTPLFSVGAYLLLASSLVMLRIHKLPKNLQLASIALLANAWFYTACYFFLAPSAELRYVLWPGLASWLVILITLFANKQEVNKALANH